MPSHDPTSIEELLGIPKMPLLPSAPSAFGLLEGGHDGDDDGCGADTRSTGTQPPSPDDARGEARGEVGGDAGSEAPAIDEEGATARRRPIRHAIATAMCILELLAGIAIVAYPSASEQLRLDEIFDEQAPIDYVIFGAHEVPVIEDYESASAPDGPVAGMWMDSSVRPQANYSYIVGHNPGPFSFVLGLEEGDEVSIANAVTGSGSFGSQRYAPGGERKRYVVDEVIDVARGTYVHEVEERFSDEEGALVLQACVDESQQEYRVVICLPQESA